MILLENATKTYTVQTLKKGHILSYERFSVKALNNVSFHITKGEAVGYVGLNGSGKSTTIKILCGILNPDSGIARINGMDPFQNKKTRYCIGAVFGQKQQLWADLPVRDSFEMLRGMYNVSRSELSERAHIISEFLDIQPLLSIPARKLSLGQRMQCEFTASLIHWPKILLLDEPTIGIDIQARKRILQLLHRLNQEYQFTIMLTTHNIADIEALCERIIVIDNGSIIFDGPKDKLKYLEKYTQMFDLVTQQEIIKEEIRPLCQNVSGIAFPSPSEMTVMYGSGQIEAAFHLINAVDSKYGITSLKTIEPTLESVISELYEKRKG